jgi:hypothetical protein
MSDGDRGRKSDDERQGRKKRVATEGYQMLRDRSKVSEWQERDVRYCNERQERSKR